MVVGDIEKNADLLVIGAGPGGYTAAIRGAQKGLDVILIEKEKVGGICLNHGCIPAKSLIHAAKYRADLNHWDEIGIHTKDVNVNFKEIQEWKKSVIERLDKGILQLLDKHDIQYMEGTARFIDNSTVRVEEEHNAETVNFDKAIIATGSQPIEIPGFEFEKERVITSRDILQIEEVPDEIIVIGGGYIGMEAVTKFCKFGATVTVLEAQDRVLSGFDEDIVGEIRETSACYGDKIFTGVKAKEASVEGDRVTVEAEKDGEEVSYEADYVLVAVGRETQPILENLEVSNADVQLADGFVQTDEQMMSNVEGIYAIGDAAGQPMLAHKAYREGKVAAEAAAGEPAAFDNQYIPKVAYTDPEIASIGMEPKEAKEKYGDPLIGRFPFSASGRALTTNKPDGFIRVIASPDEKLQGVQIVGPRASDIAAEATLALEMQAYLDDVTNTIHAHPTFPEAFAEACEDAKNESIHT